MKVIAALSAFLFTALAAMFGTNASPAQAEAGVTVLSILLFVAGTSLVLGVVFGRAALLTTTVFGGFALFIMWLPFQFYATDESLIRSAVVLLLMTFTQGLSFFIGGMVRGCVASGMRSEN